MYRPSVEKKSSSSETYRLDATKNDIANLPARVHHEPIPLAALLASDDQVETIFQTLLEIIIRGNFRAFLLPSFSRLVAAQTSEITVKILALLVRLYDFRNHKLPFSEGHNRQFKYPPLDLSASGFSDSFLSELIQQLRVLYCNQPKATKGLHSQPGGTVAFLQHIDLSNNHLRPTRRGARQLVPSVAQGLAGWLSNPTCRLQSLNLSENPALGGSTQTFDPYLKSIGYGSDIYRIIQGLVLNNSLEVLKMANTGINLVDFEALAKMLEENAALRVVDIANNPINLEGRPSLNAMLEKRSKTRRSALNLELAKTGLVEPVAILGAGSLEFIETTVKDSVATQVHKSTELVKTVPIDPVKVVGADNPLAAFELELYLQLQYLNFRSMGHRIFAEYKPEKFPHEFEYYLKLLQVVLLIVGGAVAVATPISALIGSISIAMGVAKSTVGIAHKIEKLVKDLIGLSQYLTPEMDELFSFESIHLLYEAGKDGFKAGSKSYAQIQKLKELSIKLKNGTPSAKRALDDLHCQYEAIAKLFLHDETLQTQIMMAFSHAYHGIIVRLSTEEAVRFAKDMGTPIKTALLGLALCAPLTAKDIPNLLVKHFQLIPLNLFQTLRFRNSVHPGYIRQREKSFKDIFGITRSEALKQIIAHPKQEDFKEITLSLSELLVNRAPNKYFVPVLPIYVMKSYRANLYGSLHDSLNDKGGKFTLTELLAIHRDPSNATSAQRRQLAALFFTLQTGGEDECCWHPALLQALARIKGFTLKIWEYSQDNNGSLVPYFEKSCACYEHPGSNIRIDCVDESEVVNSEYSSQVTVAIKFSQIRLEGYKAEANVPALSYDQMRENESSMVWVRDLLQRSGWECAGDVRFDISKRLQSQSGNEWTKTDRAKFGCLRANQSMLVTVNTMINEYKAQVSRAHFSIFYKNQCYQITSLTPPVSDMSVLETMLDGTLSKAIGQMTEHYNTIKSLIKPLIEEEFLSESPTFPYTLWCEGYWWKMTNTPWEIRDLHRVFIEERTARFTKSGWKPYCAWKLKRYLEDPIIVDKFLRFALEKKQLYGGWIHPNILRALAMVLNIHLEFYQLDECGEMNQHSHHTNVCPAEPKKRVRLLYLDTQRYVLLSLPEVQPGVPGKLFKWTSDNALVSPCGLYKLSVATLKELAQKEELKAIESERVVEELSKRLDNYCKMVEDLKREVQNLKVNVQEVKAEQEKQGTEMNGINKRLTNLEQNEVVKPEEIRASKQRITELESQVQQLIKEGKENAKKVQDAEKRSKEAEDKANKAYEKSNNEVGRSEAIERIVFKLQEELRQANNLNAELLDRLAFLETIINDLAPQRRAQIPLRPNNNNRVLMGEPVQNYERGQQPDPIVEDHVPPVPAPDDLHEVNPNDAYTQDDQNPFSPRVM